MSVQLDVGDWGLFCGHGGRQLVLAGGLPCGPLSARKITRSLPRRILLDEGRVEWVLETGVTLDETIELSGESWRVHVEALSSPRSGTLLGVFAIVVPAEEDLPEHPKVGCWEWEIERHRDGRPSSRRRTYWDRTLFDLYDVSPDAAAQKNGYWEAGEWANTLIDQADQMRVNGSIRDGIQDGLRGVVGRFRCLTYNVVTGYGTGHEGRRHLRLVGRVVPVAESDRKVILQGFSYEAPPTFHDMAFEHDTNAARVDDVLRGVMELSREPMAVVDPATLDILMTSPAWREQDFGQVGGVGDFTMSDTSGLHTFLLRVAETLNRSQTLQVQLSRPQGGIQAATLTATGVKAGLQSEGRDVVIRVDVA